MSMETFDDIEVKELPSEEGTLPSEDSEDKGDFESFDDDEVKDVLSDKQTNQLEDDDGSKEEPKEKEEEVKKEDQKEEPKEEKQEDPKPEFKGKPVKIKSPSGETTEIDSQSTFKVKVDGKNEIVTLDELKADYSGRVSWNKKFDDLSVDKKELEQKLDMQTREREEITGHLSKIADILDDDEKSPVEALNYLVDISGRDRLAFNKKMVNFMTSEIDSLREMDEVELDLYWKKQELDIIRSNQAAEAERQSQSKAQREKIDKVNQLRESQGVDEDQFVSSFRELESMGYKSSDITPESVVEYAVMKPHYEASEKICSEFSDDLGDEEMDKLVTEVAQTLRKNPSLSHEKALNMAVSILGWDMEELEELNELESKVEKKERRVDDSESRYGNQRYEYESFDDFED